MTLSAELPGGDRTYRPQSPKEVWKRIQGKDKVLTISWITFEQLLEEFVGPIPGPGLPKLQSTRTLQLQKPLKINVV